MRRPPTSPVSPDAGDEDSGRDIVHHDSAGDASITSSPSSIPPDVVEAANLVDEAPLSPSLIGCREGVSAPAG